MAKANLLDTKTVNFLELIGNGKIYRVPAYQRDYSWTVEQWEDLWSDIAERRGNPEDRHYMGALVVEGKSDREFLIIDGQQRMATLSILALAVIARLEALAAAGIASTDNRERARGLRSRYVGEKDPASLIESSKLFLNETDNAFYQDYLVQLREPPVPRSLPKSNRLLWECFCWFRKRLEDDREGAALAGLLSETVGRQLLFILIAVDNEINAYTVFETLNARGLELSATDLLKNYLFSLIKVGADIEVLQRRWKAMVATVKQERFPEFLRYHLLCEFPKIRQQRLFKLIRDRVKTPADVFALLEALEARAELFAALGDSRHEYWIEHKGCQKYIRDLALFRVRQMTPLLFAAWEKFSSKADFERTLKLVSIIAFRYTIVSGLNPNDLEPTYHFAAKAVLDGSARGPAEIFDKLRSIYVDDDKFRQDFAMLEVSTSGQRKHLAKYVLCRLEEDVGNHPRDADTDPASIEHIFPENPTESWELTFPQERWDAYVNRIGNLTLLESNRNREVGNKEYSEKLQAYAGSTYAMARKISDEAPEQWTPELLEARQRRMAERAAHLWRADFA
ncbi:DUF262 domain-containing protein [Rhodocyclaceae bacterium]